MALYLKRLKSQKLYVGLIHPKVFAEQICNPVLEYLEAEYENATNGQYPRSPIIFNYRDNADEDGTFWFEKDYISILNSQLHKFIKLTLYIKHGLVSGQDPEVQQTLLQLGADCAQALCLIYLIYVFLYRIEIHGDFKNDVETRNLSMKVENRGETGVLDDPTSAYFRWTDYIFTWPPWENWGKSKYDIELEKENERQSRKMLRDLNRKKKEYQAKFFEEQNRKDVREHFEDQRKWQREYDELGKIVKEYEIDPFPNVGR